MPAAGVVAIRERALFEVALFAQLLEARVELLIAHEAVARRAAHLQHHHERTAHIGLRAVKGALGKVADSASRKVLAGRVVHRAVEAEADLVEVVAMARREVVALGADHAEFEVVGRRGDALQEAQELYFTRAMARDGAELNFRCACGLHGCGISAAVVTASRAL